MHPKLYSHYGTQFYAANPHRLSLAGRVNCGVHFELLFMAFILNVVYTIDNLMYEIQLSGLVLFGIC